MIRRQAGALHYCWTTTSWRGRTPPYLTLRWGGGYIAADEDPAAVWPLAAVQLSANILGDDAFYDCSNAPSFRL